jgi:uncharacterized protein
MSGLVSSKLTRMAGLLAALALVIGVAPGPALAQRAVACTAEIVVQPGDTLASLANRYYGESSAYAAIVTATNARAAVDSSFVRIDNPNLIRQGWKLCVPGAQRTQPVTAAAPAPPPIEQLSLPVIGQIVNRLANSSVEHLRQQGYPGSALTIEQTLAPGDTYRRYLASYRSEGLRINALMTLPDGAKPPGGWPVIVVNHGYTPPALYQTTAGYEAHIDAFARNGYIVLRPDYRGHGDSDGDAGGGYDAPGYTIDVLNAVASIKRHPDAAADRIGMWGHSLGGAVTLSTMVVGGDIKAGVVWAGVSGSYDELVALWDERQRALPSESRQLGNALFAMLGTPAENPLFWDAVSLERYLADLSGPLQLHHSSTDESIPVSFARTLAQQLEEAGQLVEYYEYSGDNHNLTANFDTAITRSLAFFDFYLKPKG